MTVKRFLNGFPAPDQHQAEGRAWEVVRAAFQERAPVTRQRSYRRPLIAATVGLGLAISIVLSPAGATVGRFISRAFGIQHASPALISLPAPGRLLLSGRSGTWTVGPSGSKRWLGGWTQASWSPHGRYLAVVRRVGGRAAAGRGADELAAVTPLGLPQWGLERPEVRDPRWYPSTGYRVAYLSGSELRVVAGDGTQDHLVATGVAGVAPAWRPDHPYQLAYMAAGGGRLRVRDGDTGAPLWSASPGARVFQLAWSADGGRLVALSARRVFIYSSSGRLLSVRAVPGGARVHDAALAPDGRTLAFVARGSGNAVVTVGLVGRRPEVRRVLTGFGLGQVAYSPNGRWLLITWPAANQWVFVRVVGAPRIAAASRITQHFSTGRASHFPQLEGWCCSALGSS